MPSEIHGPGLFMEQPSKAHAVWQHLQGVHHDQKVECSALLRILVSSVAEAKDCEYSMTERKETDKARSTESLANSTETNKHKKAPQRQTLKYKNEHLFDIHS